MKLALQFLSLLFLVVPFSIYGQDETQSDFTIAFGSCNKHSVENLLWDDVLNTKPDVWIWGGDIVYADTDNMIKLKKIYDAQNAVKTYQELKVTVPVIGTWDDHDYGLNDGGIEFTAKKESQQAFLDFMDVAKDSPRRQQEGVYAVHDYTLEEGTIKVLVLDTRYFRTSLTKDTATRKRFKPNVYGEGTILGATQWKWLEDQLKNSTADFNVIVSSIQVFSNEHGYETWGNFPHEVDKLERLLVDSNAKGVILLSGDRHISEFSKKEVNGLSYPVIDFTSSGLTHSSTNFSGEPNSFRIGEVVTSKSFGTLKFDFKSKQVVFKIIGNDGFVLGELKQKYPSN
ncbi:alkaline phosphatase family protein [Flavobacterium sediminilitoris]|uniref:Alkaline phosphatase family protein n=1 Tax=Flavobacterium sediminilitoris TaxID=2024526 RepID=A0ABY4HJV2_9FLAO|nr:MULTISPECIES: alkaline phosphatase D family protein [Flavobacterium]UOX33135.1 alkaline phosphatase family protein [Flavobacterium sediminilitoris]